MPRYILLFLLLSLGSATAFAQFGIKGGITLGGTYGSAEQYDGEKIESIDPAVGYQLGIVAPVVDAGLFKLNAELVYEDRRGKKNADFTLVPAQGVAINNRVEFRNSFKYLSLPLLAAFGSDRLQVYVGPSFSYLLGAKSDVTTTTTVTPEQAAGTNGLPPGGTTTTELDLINDDAYAESYINRFNVAANAGVMIPLLPTASLDLRVYHTLTDVTNDDEDRSIIDRAVGNPSPGLRDDFDSTVGVQANLVFRF